MTTLLRPRPRLALVFFVLLLLGCGGSSTFFEGSLDALDTRVNTSTPAGEYRVESPAICCVGRRVHVAWMDDRVGLGDIRFNTSTNGTQTWLASDLRVNTDAEGAAAQWSPVICCEGNNVYVAWTDGRRPVGTQIYFNVSHDAGRTFPSFDQPVSVNVGEDTFNTGIQMCCAGDLVYATWVRQDDGAIYFNRSLNSGGTWLGIPRRLNATGSRGTRPVICCDGDRITVAWEDDRNGALDIYSNSSTDGGTTWLPAELRVDTDPAGSTVSTHPELCCLTSRVHCAWRDQREGGETVYTNFSTNSGSNWQRRDMRMDMSTTVPTEVESHSIRCTNQYVHLLWTDDRNGELDVFYRRSVNSGNSWELLDHRLDVGFAGSTRSSQVSLCADFPQVYATWSEASGADSSDWWFTYSTTNGAAGAASPAQVNATPAMTTSTTDGALCCDGSDVYGAWVDTRDAATAPSGPKADIYSRGSR